MTKDGVPNTADFISLDTVLSQVQIDTESTSALVGTYSITVDAACSSTHESAPDHTSQVSFDIELKLNCALSSISLGPIADIMSVI